MNDDVELVKYSVEKSRVEDGLVYADDGFHVDSLSLESVQFHVDEVDVGFEVGNTLETASGDTYGTISAITFRAIPDDPHFTVTFSEPQFLVRRVEELIDGLFAGAIQVS